MPARLRLAVLTGLAALITAACGAGAGPRDTVVEASSVALFPDDPGRTRLGGLRYAGGLELTSAHPAFGGWSALELSADGEHLLALSDSGAFLRARLSYQDGAPSGLDQVVITPLLGPDGAALSGTRADAEGLASLGDGRYAVSFERDHRIAVFELGADWSGIETAVETPFPAPPGADRLRNNAGIEALAIDGTRLYAGVEDPIVSGQPHTLWVYDLAAPAAPPRALFLAIEPGFGLTAMTFGPDGALYLVERFWSRDAGNTIHVSRLSAAQMEAAASAPLQPERLAEIGPDMTVDNIEAAAFAEVDGAPLLLLMSDDNFNAAQRTLLLAFQIEPDTSPAP
ncbi:esterase-like activity of phytase family protein [Maricaulaceae bacterium MS644]